MSRRILVTGSAGFLGRHLCRLIGERGDTPIGLDLETDVDAPFLQVVGSVTDPASWRTAGSVDGVIHAAALTDLWHANPSVYADVNQGGAVMAAKYAQSLGVRMVLISSYTVLMANNRQDERTLTGHEATDAAQMIGPYAQSKRQAELAAREACEDFVIVRPTAPIGPGDYRPTPPMRLLRDLAAGRLPGVMRGFINVVDVRDVAGAILAALDHPEAEDHYLLSGEDLSLKAFADAVALEAGVKAPSFEVPVGVAKVAARFDEFLAPRLGRLVSAPLDGVRLAAQAVSFDAALAKKDLGFAPRAVADSIKDAVVFVRQEWP